ncbi:MAG TPA: hypothetical protein VGN81_27055, partial [Pseudonocardiaceae bacterium]
MAKVKQLNTMIDNMMFAGGMVRSKVLVSLLAGGSIALAGCTSGGSAIPQRSQATAPVTSSTPKSEVTDPLNVDKLAGDICSSFTDAQLAPYLGALAGKDTGSSVNGPV